jgi:hypothetical protein
MDQSTGSYRLSKKRAKKQKADIHFSYWFKVAFVGGLVMGVWLLEPVWNCVSEGFQQLQIYSEEPMEENQGSAGSLGVSRSESTDSARVIGASSFIGDVFGIGPSCLVQNPVDQRPNWMLRVVQFLFGLAAFCFLMARFQHRRVRY